MTTAQPSIIARDFTLDDNGTRSPLRACMGAPRQLAPRRWVVDIWIESAVLGTQPEAVLGEDSWQAVVAAFALLRSLLEQRCARRGARLLGFDGADEMYATFEFELTVAEASDAPPGPATIEAAVRELFDGWPSDEPMSSAAVAEELMVLERRLATGLTPSEQSAVAATIATYAAMAFVDDPQLAPAVRRYIEIGTKLVGERPLLRLHG